ncbi:MAG: C40 family peptidase [Thiohalomonadales bacterium]
MKKLIIIILLSSLAVACSSSNHIRSNPTKSAQVTDTNIIKNAKAMLGIQYYFGGISPKTGFDCSGLVYYAHKKQGITLPRTTKEQLKRVRKIQRSSLRPGDLVFFAINRINVSHVGIYLGNNKFIHSPSTGKNVKISSMNTDYWRRRFVTGGRL